MGLEKEFEKAKQWIDSSFDILTASSDLSVFETNIRYVGGLLSAYGLTKEKVFFEVFLKNLRAIIWVLRPFLGFFVFSLFSVLLGEQEPLE